MAGSSRSTPEHATPAAEESALSPAEQREDIRTRTERLRKAEDRRRQVLGLVRGSKLRLGLLEQEAEGQGLEALTAQLGIAMADFAMMAVINGNVTFKDAGQAAQVAKLGIEVHRLTALQTPEDVADMTPAEREQRRKAHMVAIRTLAADLQARASAGGVTEAELEVEV